MSDLDELFRRDPLKLTLGEKDFAQRVADLRKKRQQDKDIEEIVAEYFRKKRHKRALESGDG